MEPVVPETASKENNGSNIVFASLAVLYLLICLCLGGFVFISRQKIPGIREYFPTQTALPTATIIPTVTPIVHKPSSTDRIFKDDFSQNNQQWDGYWPDDQLAVNNGQLSLTSTYENSIGITECTVCSFSNSHFYIEADFSTNKEIDKSYGIAFNIKNNYIRWYDSFYLFQINAVQGRYILYKKHIDSSGKTTWMLRLSENSKLIKPYPETNKLGVYFDKDSMEFYINGSLADTYQDPGTRFTSGEFGFYVDDSGFQLIVDNLFSYGSK